MLNIFFSIKEISWFWKRGFTAKKFDSHSHLLPDIFPLPLFAWSGKTKLMKKPVLEWHHPPHPPYILL